MDDLCSFHRRENNEKIWAIKTVVDVSASALIPGYSAAKTVAGAVSWAAGNNSGKEIVKDEFGGKLSEKAGEFVADGITPELGAKIGGYVYTGLGIIKSATDWSTHQAHVNEGKNYQRGCPICD